MKETEKFGLALIGAGLSLKSLSAGALYYGYVSQVIAGVGIGIGICSVYAGAFFLGMGAVKKTQKVEITHNHLHQTVCLNDTQNLALKM